VPELETPLPFKTTLRIAEALRLPATHLHEIMPARVARKGSTRLLVPIADPRHLDELAPNADTLVALAMNWARKDFRFRRGSKLRDLSTESRMFCPALGIAEDPSAERARHACRLSLGSRPIRQEFHRLYRPAGRQMKRPGQVNVRLEVDQGNLAAVHIGGAAVIVSEGTLAL